MSGRYGPWREDEEDEEKSPSDLKEEIAELNKKLNSAYIKELSGEGLDEEDYRNLPAFALEALNLIRQQKSSNEPAQKKYKPSSTKEEKITEFLEKLTSKLFIKSDQNKKIRGSPTEDDELESIGSNDLTQITHPADSSIKPTKPKKVKRYPKPSTLVTPYLNVKISSDYGSYINPKIAMVGPNAVGKRTFMKKFTSHTNTSYYDTIGYDMGAITCEFSSSGMLSISKSSVYAKLVMWAINPDHLEKPGLADSHTRGARGAIAVFDATKPKTFDKLVKNWVPLIEARGIKDHTIIVANKSDSQDAFIDKESEEFAGYAEKNGFMGYVEVSFKNAKNIEYVVGYLAAVINLKSTKRRIDYDEKQEYWKLRWSEREKYDKQMKKLNKEEKTSYQAAESCAYLTSGTKYFRLPKA